ncbi:MAG TPA: hypothetical protein VK468_00005, partial [Pyrinomonadaceae bacterium]|nr:hypothetical protein [Pyrinomonadaceae bacterium]
MKFIGHIRIYLLLLNFLVVLTPINSMAQTSKNEDKPVAMRDGLHDFDFQFGTWKTHIKRLRKPLTGSTDWVEYDGVSVVRKVWDGRASLIELEVDGPAGYIQGLGLRLYNPETRQWNINWANGSDSTLQMPMIGGFANGRGD